MLVQLIGLLYNNLYNGCLSGPIQVEILRNAIDYIESLEEVLHTGSRGLGNHGDGAGSAVNGLGTSPTRCSSGGYVVCLTVVLIIIKSPFSVEKGVYYKEPGY